MKTLFGLVKFIIFIFVLLIVVGIVSVFACVNKIKHNRPYIYPDYYEDDKLVLPPKESSQEVAPDNKESLNTDKINWISVDQLTESNQCVMLYFSYPGCCVKFETFVLNNDDISSTINSKFTSVKVKYDSSLHAKFHIDKYPTIMLLRRSNSGKRLSGNISTDDMTSLLNNSIFDSCI